MVLSVIGLWVTYFLVFFFKYLFKGNLCTMVPSYPCNFSVYVSTKGLLCKTEYEIGQTTEESFI